MLSSILGRYFTSLAKDKENIENNDVLGVGGLNQYNKESEREIFSGNPK